MDKTERCSRELSVWNREVPGKVHTRINQPREQIHLLQAEDPRNLRMEEQQGARAKLQSWLEREEIMWWQRSKSLQLREGDYNTKFFHHKASQRRRKNFIKGILDEKGRWQVEDRRDQVILDYFKNISSCSLQHGAIGDNLGCLEGMEGRVSEEMNQVPIKGFDAQEGLKALHQMHPSKAPGPNGMAPMFY